MVLKFFQIMKRSRPFAGWATCPPITILAPQTSVSHYAKTVTDRKILKTDLDSYDSEVFPDYQTVRAICSQKHLPSNNDLSTRSLSAGALDDHRRTRWVWLWASLAGALNVWHGNRDTLHRNSWRDHQNPFLQIGQKRGGGLERGQHPPKKKFSKKTKKLKKTNFKPQNWYYKKNCVEGQWGSRETSEIINSRAQLVNNQCNRAMNNRATSSHLRT